MENRRNNRNNRQNNNNSQNNRHNSRQNNNQNNHQNKHNNGKRQYNKDNTFNIDKVNLNIYREPTAEELQLHNAVTVEETSSGSGSGTTVVDEFVDISPKLPIEEEMQV